MEDALVVWQDIAPGLGMYAVIDGHGGSEAAAVAAFMIPRLFRRLANHAIADVSAVFREVNAELRRRGASDGAAVVVALVGRAEIGCAHLADARALVVNKSLACRALTVDHKATERSEIDLVKESGSFVDGGRTAGMLAVSRALGDFKIPGVGRVPAMTKYARRPDDYRLVLACDGVFDVIDTEEIGEILRDRCGSQSSLPYFLRATGKKMKVRPLDHDIDLRLDLFHAPVDRRL
jgi:serine/threonine protein phosphatase PrpC